MNVPWIEFAASLLAAALCVPLILRKVPKNPWYGVRTTRSMNGTDEEWYAVNHDGGLALTISGLVSAVVDLALGFSPLQPSTVYFIATTTLMAAIIVPLVVTENAFSSG